MTDWNSPTELFLDAQIFQYLIFATFGLYVWEMMVTLSFEYYLVTAQVPFKWPVGICIVTRYMALVAITLAMVLSNSPYYDVECKSMTTATIVFSGLTSLASTSIFVLRAIAVHEQMAVTAVMGVLSAAQAVSWVWAMAVFKSSPWNPVNGCAVEGQVKAIMLPWILTCASLLFSMGLTAAKVWPNASNGNSFEKFLLHDGILCYFTTLAINLTALGFVISNTNTVMNNMFVSVAPTLSAVLACRLFVTMSTKYAVNPASSNSWAMSKSKVPTERATGIYINTFTQREEEQDQRPYVPQLDNPSVHTERDNVSGDFTKGADGRTIMVPSHEVEMPKAAADNGKQGWSYYSAA